MSTFRTVVCVAALLVFSAGTASATTYTGDIFFVRHSNPPNTVMKVSYSYDDVSHTFGLTNLTTLASPAGTDSLVFDTNSHILLGRTGKEVAMYSTAGVLLDTGKTTSDAYHVSMDPAGNKVYTSNIMGDLEVLPLPGPGFPGNPNDLIGDSTVYDVQGEDAGVTTVTYSPLNGGEYYYINGAPNGNGTFGRIDMSNVLSGSPTHTVTTDRLFNASEIPPAFGMVFDSYTNLLTMFGVGRTATYNPLTNTVEGENGDLSPLFTNNFSQGDVDGLGHALVAGQLGQPGSITLIDYRISGDITNPDYYASLTLVDGVAIGAISDLALVSGSSSTTVAHAPEPTTLMLLGSGLVGAAVRLRRRQARLN